MMCVVGTEALAKQSEEVIAGGAGLVDVSGELRGDACPLLVSSDLLRRALMALRLSSQREDT